MDKEAQQAPQPQQAAQAQQSPRSPQAQQTPQAQHPSQVQQSPQARQVQHPQQSPQAEQPQQAQQPRQTAQAQRSPQASRAQQPQQPQQAPQIQRAPQPQQPQSPQYFQYPQYPQHPQYPPQFQQILHPQHPQHPQHLQYLQQRQAQHPPHAQHPQHPQQAQQAQQPQRYQTYERDIRWTAVDEYAARHLHRSDAPYHKELEYAAKAQQEGGLPDIAVSPMQGQFLAIQARLIGAKHILEVGTLGGYSTIWLASSSPKVRIVTVERDEKHAAIARKSFENAGLLDRIELIVGSALDVLRRLKEEVMTEKRPRFDLVFIDADKPAGLDYLNLSVPMSRQGALLIVDNVVRKGKLATASEEEVRVEPNIWGSRRVVEGAGRDPRLFCNLMQVVGEKNYDGFLLCTIV